MAVICFCFFRPKLIKYLPHYSGFILTHSSPLCPSTSFQCFPVCQRHPLDQPHHPVALLFRGEICEHCLRNLASPSSFSSSSAIYRDEQLFQSLSHTHRRSIQSFQLTSCMFLDYGRNPKNPKRTHRKKMQTQTDQKHPHLLD